MPENDYLCAAQKKKDMYLTGICIAAMTFVTIGICCCGAALFVENVYASSFLGVFGASALWGIGELFVQKKRVEKGWFPKNPKRKYK